MSHFTELTYLTYLKKQLSKLGKVVILTNKNLSEYKPEQFDFFFLTSYQINFYGGKPNPDSTRKWNFIAKSDKKVFQLFCDFQLPLVDYSGLLKKVFNISTNKLKPKNFYLIHYCKDLSFRDWVRKWKHSFQLLDQNCYYFDISDFHYKYQKKLKPSEECSKNICYVGNFRNNARTKLLTKVGEFLPKNRKLQIFGSRWKDKDLKLPTTIKLNDPILEDAFPSTINSFFGQIVTYDDVGIQYKSDSTRLVDTVVSGSLPIIDKRLSYLDIPDFAKQLIFENSADIRRILKISLKERTDLILKYQKYLKKKHSKIDFISIIKNA
jgi:hypothetical protein